MDIKNISMIELFDKVHGNIRKFHKIMFEEAQKDLSSVNPSSLYWEAKDMFANMKDLKNM